MDLVGITNQLRRDVARLTFSSPVAHVYAPIDYARAPFLEYLRRYGEGRREVVFMGMNPGPWGMTQTGVPFGEISYVRDWLKISGKVRVPKVMHPKVPIRGFDCHRSEVSGKRFWGWARGTFATPERFFERFFVANYCPLIFLEASGTNRTPDKLVAAERDPLLAVCDRALRRTIEWMQPRIVVGIGQFAESRAHAALQGINVTIGRILHPSPASPAANRDWESQVAKQLRAMGIKVDRAK